MKRISLVSFLSILVCTHCFADDALFRENKYKFRFLYPDNWTVEQGRGANVVAKVVFQTDTSCNVVVEPMPELVNFSSADVRSELKENNAIDAYKINFPDATTLKGGTTSVDNRRAVYSYVDFSYRAMSASTEMRSLIVTTYENGAIYTITCGTLRDLFTKYQRDFERLVTTFVFENDN